MIRIGRTGATRNVYMRHTNFPGPGHCVLLQAFLKKASVDTDNPDDSAMAQLVDGRAFFFCWSV